MNEDTELTGSLKIRIAEDKYSIVGLHRDALIKIASESPTFRSYLSSLTRGLQHHYPKHSDVIGLRTHLDLMDERDKNPEPTETPSFGVEELIEMLKLQQQVNESYAKLAILLGEAYVGKAQR